ncbi:A-kinase anchor protein 14-like [Anneissia japonica]|uniref:A-kinase anchor protein 14-like n=1 Tax=Anneissia japonica TaxID=1529436 RepID=UPI0014255AA2|nr:A-kinase anchor protein 14-like [Anneissia japonica]
MNINGDSEGFENQAHELVDRVIDNARKRILKDIGVNEDEDGRPLSSIRSYSTLLYRETEDYEIKDIVWMTIEEFSVEEGEKKINEFVQTWDYEDSWLYCIDFLREEEDDFSKKYRYQVRWSIPTRRKPIPRATACVYFTIEVSKMKPKHFPVDVYYIFETNRLVHKPGQSRFRSRWLKDVIENKTLMMNAIDF